MWSHVFNIPDGYRIEESKTNYNIDDAVAILSGRGGNHVTEAHKLENNQASLVKHRLVCPHCRAVIPAYVRHLQDHFNIITPVPAKVSSRTIKAWGGAQSSLWDDAEESLILNQVYTPREQYTCTHCSLTSMPARGTIPVTIARAHKKVTITCCTTDIGELFRVPWKAKRITTLAFPFYERVTFNLKTGRTFISLHDNKMNRLATRNISSPQDWKESKIYQLLSENTLIRRNAKKCMQTYWTVPIPFTQKELTPDLFVKLVAYVDFPGFFYSRIPAAVDEYRAEKSFRSSSVVMHTAKTFQAAISQSKTTFPKSIRKLLYSFPDYGFYLPEIELLSRLFPNTDSLRAIFGRSFTYPLLSFLHQHKQANIEPFFTDYIHFKGTKNLLSKLEQKHHEVLLYALRYACLSPSAQALERKKWKVDRHILCVPRERYALPMRCNTQIPDTRIGGLQFVQLKSKAEYIDASNQLSNCLKSWGESSNPVFVIRGAKILGAIEVADNGHIIQVRGEHNEPLPESCEPAYAQWKARYHLTERSYLPDDDDDDDGDHDNAFPYTAAYLPFMFF